MPRRNIYERNYARLRDLLGQAPERLPPNTVYRLRADGFMDLVVEMISPDPTTEVVLLSLCHYFEQNGDLCQDPEMEVRIFQPGDERFREFAPSTEARHGRIEALTFRQAIPPVHRVAYSKLGVCDLATKMTLNYFLAFWLRSLKKQGYRIRG